MERLDTCCYLERFRVMRGISGLLPGTSRNNLPTKYLDKSTSTPFQISGGFIHICAVLSRFSHARHTNVYYFCAFRSCHQGLLPRCICFSGNVRFSLLPCICNSCQIAHNKRGFVHYLLQEVNSGMDCLNRFRHRYRWSPNSCQEM
jgi:hypothetical protein